MESEATVELESVRRPYVRYWRRTMPAYALVALLGITSPMWLSFGPMAFSLVVLGMLSLVYMINNADMIAVSAESRRWEAFVGRRVFVLDGAVFMSADARRRLILLPFGVSGHGPGVSYEELSDAGVVQVVTRRAIAERRRLGPPDELRAMAVHGGQCSFWLGSPPNPSAPDRRRRMAEPAALLWEQRLDTFFLARVDRSGRPAGLTVHPSEDDAYRQIRCEFGVEAPDWLMLPADSQQPLRDAAQLLGLSAGWPPR